MLKIAIYLKMDAFKMPEGLLDTSKDPPKPPPRDRGQTITCPLGLIFEALENP